MRTAFIAVDVQEGWFPDQSVIDSILRIADESDVVIASRNLFLSGDTDSPTAFIKGTKWAKICPPIKDIADYTITKGENNGGFTAFEASTLRPIVPLEDILKDEKIDRILVGGFLLGYCVSRTACDANALGYSTAVDLSASRPYGSTTQPEVEILTRAGVEVVNPRPVGSLR